MANVILGLWEALEEEAHVSPINKHRPAVVVPPLLTEEVVLALLNCMYVNVLV